MLTSIMFDQKSKRSMSFLCLEFFEESGPFSSIFDLFILHDMLEFPAWEIQELREHVHRQKE